MSWWEELALPLRLDLSREEVEEAFRDRGAAAHPDAGGARGDFERLREARDGLLDPGKRLESWLALHGVEKSHSGAVSDQVATMFGRVGEVNGGVDAWSAKGETVASGLGKALWQKEGWAWKERVESLQGELQAWQEALEARFTELQKAAEKKDFQEAVAVRNELGFLRKWQRELQARFGKLWEGLV